MGCISCKTVKLESIQKMNLRGKARLPGIPRRQRKNKVAPINCNPEDISAKINREKAMILQQLQEENIIAKRASGGISYTITDENEDPAKPACPPRRLSERLTRPSTSLGFNSEEREIMAECLKKDSLQEKSRPARLSQERRFIAEMNREKAMKIKALKLEKKLKTRGEKVQQMRKLKEQMTSNASICTYEKQQKAKYRRENAKKEQAGLSGETDFNEKKDCLLNSKNYQNQDADMGLPGVEV